ncbi:hypothetical protein BU16DRAFT_536184 [Lophium mytilinum]|uniref:2EXR domain-containing protein n=1 Tax=Lophium mytilinum TaxID=390894 RepID=A0A6A6R5Q8_9PEZI|nr:hypothetical protein BU16DRAFT_536184 [Lophium mytilinum]
MPRHKHRRTRPPPKRDRHIEALPPADTMTSTPGVPIAPTALPQAPVLPPELRRQIWPQALIPTQRQWLTLSRNVGDNTITITPPPLGILQACAESRNFAREEMLAKGLVLTLTTAWWPLSTPSEIYFNYETDILHVHTNLDGNPPKEPGASEHSVDRKLASLSSRLSVEQRASISHLAVSCLPTTYKMSMQERHAVGEQLQLFENLASLRVVVVYLPEDTKVAGKKKNWKELGRPVKTLFEGIVKMTTTAMKQRSECWGPYVQLYAHEIELQDVDDSDDERRRTNARK